MSRTEWTAREHFAQQSRALDLTVLITHHKTKRLTQLALESLLRFYPDIPILVTDNDSQDDSTLYLDWKAIVCPNVRVWHRTGLNSHGVAMDEAIHQHITTRYVMLMDTDVIIERGGFIEPMLAEFSNKNLYAIGTYMSVSFENDGCGGPHNENDVLHYAHPSLSIYDRERYLTLPPFANHGAPCCYNNKGAQMRGLYVKSWPIDLYVSHMSGASWTTPRTIWQHDHGVLVRPFVTFITDWIQTLQKQTDKDFDVLPPGEMGEGFFCVIPIQGKANPRHIKNEAFPNFYKATGEYVCRFSGELPANYVDILKHRAIDGMGANVIDIDSVTSYRRNYWQEFICLAE